ncbi:hypothetical protein DXG01_007615 [Tephrocybe rancida]|nr:hypothetical protein DXG01_007615 [Tephrocybe rancida]
MAAQIRHAAWILRCISENFLMPVGLYILDGAPHTPLHTACPHHSHCPDDFDPSLIETAPVINTTAAANANTQTRFDSRQSSPSQAHPANPRKRTFVASKADGSYIDVDPRIAKRPRVDVDDDNKIQVNRDKLVVAAEVGADLQRIYDSGPQDKLHVVDEPERKTQPLPEERLNTNTLHHGDRSITFVEGATRPDATFEPAEASNIQTSNGTMHKYIDLRTLDDRHLKAKQRSNFKPRIKIKTMAQQPGPEPMTTRPLTPRTLPSPGPASTLNFWQRARETYSGSGPLVLQMDDILRAGCTADARRFKPPESCFGEEFGYFLRSPRSARRSLLRLL